MAEVTFNLDRGGLIELCKSGEMYDFLLSQAQNMANAANAAAIGHEKALHISEFKKPPYAAKAKVLTYTCIGIAHANSTIGQIDERKFSTLSAQNH